MVVDVKSPALEQLVDKLWPDLPTSLVDLRFRPGPKPMLDYGELLRFMANNPPEGAAERQVHASMLELIANCMRENEELGSSSERIETLAQLRARYDVGEASRAHHH